MGGRSMGRNGQGKGEKHVLYERNSPSSGAWDILSLGEWNSPSSGEWNVPLEHELSPTSYDNANANANYCDNAYANANANANANDNDDNTKSNANGFLGLSRVSCFSLDSPRP
jgi:hypothetical protein